jgi:hypothetical protein
MHVVFVMKDNFAKWKWGGSYFAFIFLDIVRVLSDWTYFVYFYISTLLTFNYYNKIRFKNLHYRAIKRNKFSKVAHILTRVVTCPNGVSRLNFLFLLKTNIIFFQIGEYEKNVDRESVI